MPRTLAVSGRLVKRTCLVVLFTGLTAVQALTPAGPNRPPAVPEGYVITPFGYFHPTCVMQLAEGDMLQPDEDAIKHADGSFESMPACAFPHYKADGEMVASDPASAEPPKIGDSWVEAMSASTTSSYGQLDGIWKVPPAPTSHDGQTIFFFTGLKDYKDAVNILQPVMGWNSDFHDAWGIASWNCCAKGTTYKSSPVPVNTGDTISGEMAFTCKPGTVSCGSWNIAMGDYTTHKVTYLINSSSHGQTFNWAFGAVLEVYNVIKCSDYPPNGSFVTNAQLLDYKFKEALPSWTLSKLYTKLTPQCGYGAHANSSEITLTY
jgi:hypothetical protein